MTGSTRWPKRTTGPPPPGSWTRPGSRRSPGTCSSWRDADLHDRHRAPDRPARRRRGRPDQRRSAAARADLQPRYVREWLGAMVTGGIAEYDPATGTYRLPAEHAACLTEAGVESLAPYSRLDTRKARRRGRAGVPGGRRRALCQFRPEFTDVMDALGRGVFDELLVEAYLPLVPGWGRGWRPAAGWPTSAAAPGTRWCSWPATPGLDVRRLRPGHRRRRGPGPRRPQPGWPTPGSRSATPPA